MEINSNNINPLLTSNNQGDKVEEKENVTVKKTRIEHTPEGVVRAEYDYVFKNADAKFLESFSKITSSRDITEASALKTKVEVNMVNYHKEQIENEVISKLGDDVELTDEMRLKIYNEAVRRSEEDGFGNINMNDFFGFVNNRVMDNPYLEGSPDEKFYRDLAIIYNTGSIDSKG